MKTLETLEIMEMVESIVERWQEGEIDSEQALEEITEATEGKNKQLLCSIGYKQTVNSVEGRVNSEKNGTIICGRLRTIFKA